MFRIQKKKLINSEEIVYKKKKRRREQDVDKDTTFGNDLLKTADLSQARSRT